MGAGWGDDASTLAREERCDRGTMRGREDERVRERVRGSKG